MRQRYYVFRNTYALAPMATIQCLSQAEADAYVRERWPECPAAYAVCESKAVPTIRG